MSDVTPHPSKEEDTVQHTSSPLEIPDKFSGGGLTSVIGCFLFNFNSWGANSAYSLYLQHYLNTSVFPGARKIDYGIIGGLTFGAGLTFGPFVNYLCGKLGLKATIAVGIVFQFAAVLLASFAVNLWQLYLTQGVLQGIGLALICITNVNVVPQWFSSGPNGKRNLALGFTSAGSGIGGIVYNIGLEPLLTKHGYQWSLRTQAIMCAVLNSIALLLIKSRNKHIRPIYKVYDRVVWTNFGCWCLTVWEMFTLFGYVTLMYNLGDFTRSLGYDSRHASIVATMTSVGIIYGRPSVGQLCDRFGPINVTIAASWLVALFSLAMWIPCRNYATAIVLAMFVGSLMGTIWITMSSMTASIIGLRKFGIAMALSWIATGVFGFIGPVLGVVLKAGGPVSPTQYQHPAIFVGVCYFMAGVTLVVLRGWYIVRNRMCGDSKDEELLWTTRVPVGDGLRSVFEVAKT